LVLGEKIQTSPSSHQSLLWSLALSTASARHVLRIGVASMTWWASFRWLNTWFLWHPHNNRIPFSYPSRVIRHRAAFCGASLRIGYPFLISFPTATDPKIGCHKTFAQPIHNSLISFASQLMQILQNSLI
jgi:hypothetical protein